MLWIRVELEARARDRFNGGVWGPEQMRCDIDDRSVNLRVEPGGHTIGVDVDGEEPFEITADDAHAGIAHLLHLLDLADQQTS